MNLKIKIISPLHIGSGNELSPYTDYIYKDNYLLYLDNQKLWNDISKNEEMIDEYVQIIKNKDSNSKNKYTLLDFLKNNNIDIDKYIYAKIKCYGDIKTVEINETIKTSGRPYIPGSSLKGAIRTAILYDYLKTNSFNLNDIINMSSKKDRRNTYVGQDVMRKYPKSIQSDIMKFLYVSDTNCSDINNISANIEYCIDYVDMKKCNEMNKKMPIGFESINPETEFTFNIKCIKSNKFFKDEAAVLNSIKDFSKDILERDIKIMKDSNEKLFSNIISKYTGYLNEIDNNVCIMRLGSNKNYYDNTICNLFHSEDVREKIMQVKYKPFPKTDWFILDSQNEYIEESLGWIKIINI